MKTITLNEFEQEYLKDCVSYRINSINKTLLLDDDFGMYDTTENRLRKMLEDLSELEKKIS
jgi:hypothetical protein